MAIRSLTVFNFWVHLKFEDKYLKVRKYYQSIKTIQSIIVEVARSYKLPDYIKEFRHTQSAHFSQLMMVTINCHTYYFHSKISWMYICIVDKKKNQKDNSILCLKCILLADNSFSLRKLLEIWRNALYFLPCLNLYSLLIGVYSRVVRVIYIKSLAAHYGWFESRQGLWIISCEKAIQLS